jgi:uncharacterized protein YjiS (DUF1127 family)
MIAIAKPFAAMFRLPAIHLPRLNATRGRRKRATLDLIHASPHLLRDIGLAEGQIPSRGR